jgi:hypothetical protein
MEQVRVLSSERGGHGPDLRVGLEPGRAVPKASEDGVVFPLIRRTRPQTQRRDDVGGMWRLGKGETRRKHAQDPVGPSVEHEAPVQHVRHPTEAVTPEGLAHDHHVLRTDHVVLGAEASPHDGSLADNVEEAPAHPEATDALERPVSTQLCRELGPGRHGLEGAGGPLPEFELESRDVSPEIAFPLPGEVGHPVGLRERHGTQHHAVHYAEQGSTGPDADAEGHDRHQCHGGGPEQASDGEPEILPHHVHHVPPPLASLSVAPGLPPARIPSLAPVPPPLPDAAGQRVP